MNSKSDEKDVNPAPRGPRARLKRRGLWVFASIVVAEVALGSVLLQLTAPPVAPQHETSWLPAALQARVAPQAALSDAERVAKWAVSSGDAGRQPFVIVDKANARVMAFDAAGRLHSSTPALLGLARGDDSVPGIGDRKMADITPPERITPAGRFVAQRGVNLEGEDIVWIDYDAAVSMHRVRARKASEQRMERLASETVEDNRISYGCINLPVAFYETVLHPMVAAGPVVVYVLPESRALHEVFALAPSPSAKPSAL